MKTFLFSQLILQEKVEAGGAAALILNPLLK